MGKRPRPPLRTRRYIELPVEVWERVDILIKATESFDHHELIGRAVRYLDRGVCAVIVERSDILIHHRDGTLETMNP